MGRGFPRFAAFRFVDLRAFSSAFCPCTIILYRGVRRSATNEMVENDFPSIY